MEYNLALMMAECWVSKLVGTSADRRGVLKAAHLVFRLVAEMEVMKVDC
jgi:hypothetical protein